MDALLTSMVLWLAANFALPATFDHPKLRFVAAEEIVVFRYRAITRQQRRQVLAHIQTTANLKYECPAAREKLAYAAQEKWLGLFNLSLASEFNIDPFTLKVATECAY